MLLFKNDFKNVLTNNNNADIPELKFLFESFFEYLKMHFKSLYQTNLHSNPKIDHKSIKTLITQIVKLVPLHKLKWEYLIFLKRICIIQEILHLNL